MDEGKSRGRMRAELGVLFTLAVVALIIRLYYVRTAFVDHPVRGDAVQYFAYALNLINHHTFSLAMPDAANHAPDSFRDPGYSTLLALIGLAQGTGQAFYLTLLDVQSLLGALTVLIYAILVRRWLGFGWAVGTAVLMALWPHGIAMGGYILSETLFGFLVGLALLAVDNAMRSGRAWQAGAAGLAFAGAALTNAVVLPFAPLVGVYMLWRDAPRRRFWCTFLICALLPALAWGIRAVALPAGQSSGDRATINLVQGSWPEYHPEYIRSFQGDPKAVRDMAAIDAEFQLLKTNRTQGVRAMASRMGADPLRYIGWYFSKPVELWGWNIGIGQGDIYVFPTGNSPLTAGSFLRATTGLCFFVNPFIMILAAVGAVLALYRRDKMPAGLTLAARLGLFVTGVFAVLQSDARYATPFRGIEMALAMVTLAAAAGHVRAIRARNIEVTDGRNAS